MIWSLIVAGLIIGSNNFAAAIAIGALGGKKYRLRIVSVFAGIEFLAPLLGLWLGGEASGFLGDAANAISVAILVALSAMSFYAANKPPKEDKRILEEIASPKGLIMLELGLCIDNLIAGFGLGLNGSSLPPVALAAVIALFSATYTFIGLSIGSRLSKRWENYSQFGAGILLLALALLVGFGVF